MKETTRFMMLLAWLSISAFTLTSCLNSDDDEDEIVPALMTETEISNYLSTFSGYHLGNLKVFFQNEQGKQDSATVSTPCTVSLDKKVTFSEFPVSILKNYIKGEGSQELREALEAKEDMPMVVNMKDFWNITNNTTGASNKFFYIIPNNRKLEFTLNYGGKEHQAVINFTESVDIGGYSFASQGMVDERTKKLQMMFIISSFTVDNYIEVSYASVSYSDI